MSRFINLFFKDKEFLPQSVPVEFKIRISRRFTGSSRNYEPRSFPHFWPITVEVTLGGVEFRRVASFDNFNLIGSTRKLARVQRGLESLLLLLPLPFPWLVGASAENPGQCTSSQRNLQPTPSLCNFAILRNCY